MQYDGNGWIESQQTTVTNRNVLGIQEWEEYATLSGKFTNTIRTITDH